MATLPLLVGAIASCEWEGMGTMLLRDNTGNGNLIWLSNNSTVLDLRVSTDNGGTWSEPTALGAETALGSTWAQDAAGNLHGILPNATATTNPAYRKITLTRTSGNITSAAETTTFTLACITGTAGARSWSIAIINDGQPAAKERVAIAWVDLTAASRFSVRCIITKVAVGVSPTVNTDFKAFDETTATGELLLNVASAVNGTSTGYCMKIAQLPSTATTPYRLYVAARMYDSTNISVQKLEVYEATWKGVVGAAPYWNTFASKATGSTPAENAIHNIDLLTDATNNRIVFAGQDTTSTTVRTLDIWTIASDGTLDKNGTFPQINYALLTNPAGSGKLALDENGRLWAFMIENSTGSNIGVAYYTVNTWTVNYQVASITVAPEDICVSQRNNRSNRIFYAIATDGASNDPCVMSVNIAAENKTLKTSAGDYSASKAAMQGAPDLVLYDYTLTVSVKAYPGWEECEVSTQTAEAGNTASRTVVASKTFLVQSATADRHAGKYDVAKTLFGTTAASRSAVTLANPRGTGTIKFSYIQFEQAGSTASFYAFHGSDQAAGSDATSILVDKCLFKYSGSAAGSAVFIDTQKNLYRLNNCASFTTTGGTTVVNCFRFKCSDTADAVKAYNCSAYNSGTSTGAGFYGEGTTTKLLTNCVAEMAGSAVYAFVDSAGGWGTSDYNVAAGALNTAVGGASFTLSEGAICPSFACTPAPGGTVNPTWLNRGISVYFDNVTVAGYTTISLLGTCTGATDAFNTTSASVCYNIQTTATYTGEVRVCITYCPINTAEKTYPGPEPCSGNIGGQLHVQHILAGVATGLSRPADAKFPTLTPPADITNFDGDGDGSNLAYATAPCPTPNGCPDGGTICGQDVAVQNVSPNSAPGAHSLNNKSATDISYVDKTNGDLHIGIASVLRKIATSLETIFTDDVDGATRPLLPTRRDGQQIMNDIAPISMGNAFQSEPETQWGGDAFPLSISAKFRPTPPEDGWLMYDAFPLFVSLSKFTGTPDGGTGSSYNYYSTYYSVNPFWDIGADQISVAERVFERALGRGFDCGLSRGLT